MGSPWRVIDIRTDQSTATETTTLYEIMNAGPMIDSRQLLLDEAQQQHIAGLKEGSTESIYQPAHSQTLKEALPTYQCSPLLRCKPEWGGSDPAINSDRPQSTISSKRRSYLPTSLRDNEALEEDINHACWMSSCDRQDLCHQRKVRNRETCESSMLTQDDRRRQLNSDRTQTHLPAQMMLSGESFKLSGLTWFRRRLEKGGEAVADAAESIHTTRRLRKLQNLVQTKRGNQSGAEKGKSKSENDDHLEDMLSNSNPVLTCIGLGRRTEKKAFKTPPSAQRRAKDPREDSEEGPWSPRVGSHLWRPFDCSQPWIHTCQQPRHELWLGGGTLPLPRATEWDRFESLIQELDSKQADMCYPQMIRSITDLHLAQNRLTRFGRYDAFRQHLPLMKPQDNVSSAKQNGEAAKLRLQGSEPEGSSRSDRSRVKASPEKTLTAVTNGETREDKVEEREHESSRPFIKGHEASSNSLESLCSLNSGQSSSSGVTSGSNCSSNRGSLRLEDDPPYTRQFCGRARVHTEFVPSPYDTESLTLKVGDVIDIITKPPMGIWTGMLNNRIGHFKFIYVDVLVEEIREEIQALRLRHKCRCTARQVLKRLSLEEYSSSLQLNGYQTADDLMKLKERHLTGLNVTDPEHRRRLLAAVDSLQQLCSDCQLQNEANQEAETPSENAKADMNNCPRDSGCHMPSDSPDNSGEDADLHFLSEHPPPAEATASYTNVQ